MNYSPFAKRQKALVKRSGQLSLDFFSQQIITPSKENINESFSSLLKHYEDLENIIA